MNQKKKYLSLIIGLLLLSAILILTLCKKEDKSSKDLPMLCKDGVLHIVTNYDIIGYHASSDTIAGFNHDLLQLIHHYTKLKFKISIENSLEKSFDGLNSGKYDLIARNIPINSKLKDKFKFTDPIIHSKLILVQRNSLFNNGKKPIRNRLELAHKTLYVSKGSPAILRLHNLAEEIGDTIYIHEDEIYNASSLAMMVAKGDIDYAICDESIAEKMLSVLPEIDIKTAIGFTHLEAWAVRADAPILTDSLNAWIDRSKLTPQYKKIYNKYY